MIMIMGREVGMKKILTCCQCWYKWPPKVKQPKECPSCKSRRWQAVAAREGKGKR